MKRVSILIFCFLGLFLGQSCHQKKNTEEKSAPVELNEQTVTAFAQKIADGIVHENADALNTAFDEDGIRQLVSGNSIVYSGFDVEGGQVQGFNEEGAFLKVPLFQVLSPTIVFES